MIYGLTHDKDSGDLNETTSYYGKISTGYGPNEGPNRHNYPVSCGFYRILVQKIATIRQGNENVNIEKWVENVNVHNKVGKEPKRLEFVCMGKEPKDIWHSRLAYWANGKIRCRGDGKQAIWHEAKNDGTVDAKPIQCPYHDCDYFKAEKCRAEARLKINLKEDFHLMTPYKLDTKSINSIRSIESSLNNIFENLFRIHALSGKAPGEFGGLRGLTLLLVLKSKKTNAGNIVFISHIEIPEKSENAINQAFIEVSKNNKLGLLPASNDKEVLRVEEEVVPVLESSEAGQEKPPGEPIHVQQEGGPPSQGDGKPKSFNAQNSESKQDDASSVISKMQEEDEKPPGPPAQTKAAPEAPPKKEGPKRFTFND